MEHDKFLVLSNYSKWILPKDSQVYYEWIKQPEPTMFKLSSIIRADAKGDQTVLYTETGEFMIQLDFQSLFQFLKHELPVLRGAAVELPYKE